MRGLISDRSRSALLKRTDLVKIQTIQKQNLEC